MVVCDVDGAILRMLGLILEIGMMTFHEMKLRLFTTVVVIVETCPRLSENFHFVS